MKLSMAPHLSSVVSLRVCDAAHAATLLDSVVFPDRPCAVTGDGGFAYYAGSDVATVRNSRAKVIVCHKSLGTALNHPDSDERTIILTDDPQLLFSLIARDRYAALIQPRGIWEGNPDGTLPTGISIRRGAVVYDNVTIGANSVIGANCVIGDAGFGFARNGNGAFVSMPHFGGVRIGDNVEIGPGSVIDCGTFGDTVIEGNARIDNMVQIAHNVTVGAGTRIMASVSVSGGVRIGRDCWIAPQALIRDGLRVGDGVLIGCSSMVTTDIPDRHRYQPRYAELHRCVADERWDQR